MIDIESLSPEALLALAQMLPELHRKAMLTQAARGSLLDFAKLVIPGYETPPHIRLLASKLEAVERGELKRLSVSLPPRHGKSHLCSEIFPAWFMGRNPQRHIISATYSEDLAQDWGRKVKTTMTDPMFGQIFPGVTLKEDSKAARRFTTSKGGNFFAVGSGGVITGRGAHVLLCDDLIRGHEEAMSAVQRKSTIEWYRSVAATRLEKELSSGFKGAIILIGTRWHEEDVIGWALAETAHEGWESIILPAVCDSDADPLARPIGAALWPAKYDLDDLKRIELTEGPRNWAALYQQQPSVEDGNIFKRDFWQRWKMKNDKGKIVAPDEIEYTIMAFDCAYSEKNTADFTAITIWGVFQHDGVPNAFMLGGHNKRVPYFELREFAMDLLEEWQPDQCIIENASSGGPLIQDMRRAGFPVLAVNTTRDKTTRAYALQPILESGRVWIPDGKPYAEALVEQAAKFPYGKHDDLVDSMMLALERLAAGYFIHAKRDPQPEAYTRSEKKGYW